VVVQMVVKLLSSMELLVVALLSSLKALMPLYFQCSKSSLFAKLLHLVFLFMALCIAFAFLSIYLDDYKILFSICLVLYFYYNYATFI